MRIAVLGPLEVDEGRILLAPRDQVVLEALAARPGDTVRAEALAEALWGERLPPSWSKVVQGCVSRLRKALGSAAIVTSGTGYRLVLHRDDVDHLRFEDLLRRAGELLATGEPERARYASEQALGLWRGDPLERLSEWEAGRIESERLGERRRDAEDLYAESAIRAGRHGDVLGELHRMVAQEPTRERRWGLLALAQYQAGRQAEALSTLQRARATLVNDFGLDPGPQLAELEEAILRQDPALVAGRTLPTTPATCPYLGSMAWSPDGQTVVVAGQDLAGDGILRVSVLDPHTLATTRTFSGSQASGYDLIAFSVDGEQFVTVGGGGVTLWDARDPKILGTVRADAFAAGFDSDNATILVASPQGAVSAWDPRSDEAVKVACRIVGRDLTEAEWRAHLPDRPRQRIC